MCEIAIEKKRAIFRHIQFVINGNNLFVEGLFTLTAIAHAVVNTLTVNKNESVFSF